MLQNFRLIEMTAHLDREVIPERRCTLKAAVPTVCSPSLATSRARVAGDGAPVDTGVARGTFPDHR